MTSEFVKEAKKTSSGVRVFRCAGCRGTITDQYLFQVAPDLEWHGQCLRCAECLDQLDEQKTCFVRDGKTYCKTDYLRLFGIKCFGCRLGFKMSDLVMKARQRIYHVDCFRCAVCRRRLVPGDEYAVVDDHDVIFCRHDYDALEPCLVGGRPTGTPSPSPSSPLRSTPGAHGVGGGGAGGLLNSGALLLDDSVLENSSEQRISTKNEPSELSCSNSCSSSSGAGGGGGVSVGVGVLTSRSTSDPGATATAAATTTKKTTGSGSTAKSASGGSSGSSHGSGGGRKAGSGGNGDQRTTRVRTVLNEKQLHTLRTCYAANPRPDALMKDQLVEMTGLSARVIRVWFQNKRCKDKKRTILIKQIQQQQHEKLHGVPMIATSPVRHDPSQTMSATPVEVHQYIQRPSHQWTPSPVSGGGGADGGIVVVEYAPSSSSISTVQPPPGGARPNGQCDPQLDLGQHLGQGQGQGQAPFQQLLSSFGESEDDDDDDDVGAKENSSFYHHPHHHHPHHLPRSHHHHHHHVTGSAGGHVTRRMTSRLGSEIPGHLSLLHPLSHSFSSAAAVSIGNHLVATPPHLNTPPSLQAFDAKC